MNWTELTQNVTQYVGRLKTRFPNVDEESLCFVTDRDRLVHHVAERHDLTNFEADQEIDDWLFVESLARQATELRAG